VFEGALNGFALGIHHGLLGCDDDFRFHSRAGNVAEKDAAGRAIFNFRARTLNLPVRYAIV
jgi:hypothetical protein